MELKTCFDFDFKAKSINNNTFESTVFISHIDYNDSCIACAGNGFVKLYNIDNGEVNTYFGTGQKALSDMQFANKHSNLLCTSSCYNGIIAIYDIRCNNKQNSKNKSKQICLLYSPNKQNKELYSVTMDNNIIVGSGNKDIYLWDKRKISNQNSNNNCYTLDNYHCDDVTKVLFNKLNNKSIDKQLYSISEDTLLNEYDLTQKDDNILINTYSLEKELWNFGFFYDCKNIGNNENENEFIYALSNDESLIIQQINNNNDDIKQQDIGNDMCIFETNILNNMTLIDCFYDYNNYKQLYLLSCNKNGKLRISNVTSKNVNVLSESNDGHKTRIRCAKYIEKIGCIFTGGEDNKIAMWKFDPINIKKQILSDNNNNDSKIVTLNDDILFSGSNVYGPRRETNKVMKTKHYSPY